MLKEHISRWHLMEGERKFLHTPVGIFLFGAFLGELAPDPTDAVHFWLQEHVIPYTHGLMHASLEVFDWYFLSASYFLLLFMFAYFLHIKNVASVKKFAVVGGLLGIGAVIGILARVLFTA